MKSVIIGLTTPEAVSQRFIRAWETGEPQAAQIGFLTIEDLWNTLTPDRWEILKAMTGAGPLAIRDIATRVGRDLTAVGGDLRLLVNAGLLEKTGDGNIVFPYDEVHVDFVLKAA
jgi:predicted transcriptional regulator